MIAMKSWVVPHDDATARPDEKNPLEQRRRALAERRTVPCSVDPSLPDLVFELRSRGKDERLPWIAKELFGVSHGSDVPASMLAKIEEDIAAIVDRDFGEEDWLDNVPVLAAAASLLTNKAFRDKCLVMMS